MYGIAWKEFNESGRLVIKKKSFTSAEKMNSFVRKLFGKENFCEIIAMM